MGALLRAFLEIALRRRGPASLPASDFLLALAASAFAFAGVSGMLAYGYSATETGLSMMLDLVMLSAFAGVVTYAWRRPARMKQTLTALLGTGTLFTLASIPLTLFARAGEGSDAAALAVILLFTLIVWNVVVFADIVHAAIENLFGVAVLLVMIYFVASFAAFRLFLPAEG